MKIWPTAYARHQYARTAERQFVVSIEFSSGSLEYFTSHTGITDIPAGAIEGVFSSYSAISQYFEPETGASRIGNLAVDLVDKAGAVTDAFQARLAAGTGIRAKRVRLYKGFAGLSWNDFQLKITQDIYNDVEENRGRYRIGCSDIQRAMRKEIFRAKETTLDATLTASATSMTVADNADFELVEHGTSYSHGPSETWGYVQVDDEIIGYTGKSGSTLLTGLARGLFNTIATAHVVDAGDPPERRPEVTEYVYLEMPVPKMIKALQTGELHDQASATLPEHWHMGIDTADLVESQYTGIGLDLWDPSNDSVGLIANFGGIEAVDGKRFIETELYLLAQIFSPVQTDGRLGLKRFTPALAAAAHVATLNESNVVKHSALKHRVRDVVNRVVLNWSWILGQFRRQTIKLDTDSIAKFGEAPIKVFNFRGLAANRVTQTVIDARFDAIRDRAASPPLDLTCNVSKSLDRIELADVVRVQLPNVRDMSANSINPIDRAFEVRRIAEDMRGLRFTLFGSSAEAVPVAPDVNALPDAFYDSEGTELSTVVNITADVTDAGTFTLTGDPDLAQSVFYYLGDLTIAATTTLQIDDNVQLRVRGTLTLNGVIDGIGRGLAGVADGATINDNPSGQTGFFGATLGGDGVEYELENETFTSRPPRGFVSALSAAPFLNLNVNGNALEGLPDQLRGCSGGPGGKLVNTLLNQVEGGGTGGAGGSGLMLITRGLLLGVGASIDLSGADGQAGTLGQLSNRDFYPGGGAGGAPGCLYVLLDGDRLVPSIADVFTAIGGNTPIDGTPLPYFSQRDSRFLSFPATGFLDNARRITDEDWTDSAFRVQFIPVPETPVEDLPDQTISSYYILATAGNAIKNGTGELTIEAHRIFAGIDELLSTGTIKLYDPSDQEITVANGYATGSDGFTGVLDSGDINGSIVVTLKDGPTGDPLDTISLVDIADGGAGTPGADGDDAVAGYVEPSNGLAYTRAINAGAWTPATLTTDLDCTFVQGGVEVARIARRITLEETDGTFTAASTAHKDGDLNTARVNVTLLGSGTTSITVLFEYSFGGDTASVAETVISSQGGASGSSSIVTNVFQRSASAPSTPAADDGSYNFTTGVLTPPSGWSTTPPAADGNPLYVSTGSFSIVGQAGTDNTVTWSTPAELVSDGVDGIDGGDGNSSFVATVFRRLATTPATPTLNDGSYNFSTQTLTPPTDWSTTPPADDGNPLWTATGIFEISGTTGTDGTVSWTAPALLINDRPIGLVADPFITRGSSFWDVSDSNAAYVVGGGIDSSDKITLDTDLSFGAEAYTEPRRGPDDFDAQSAGKMVINVRWRVKLDVAAGGTWTQSVLPRIRISDDDEGNASLYTGAANVIFTNASSAGSWFDDSATIEIDDTGTPPRYIQVGVVVTNNGLGPTFAIDALEAEIVGTVFAGNDKPGTVPNPTTSIGNVLKDDGTWDNANKSEINEQNGSYTLLLADAGKTIYKASGGAGETITIPANSGTAFEVGTIIGIDNDGGGDLTIAITSDELVGTDGSTGSKTLGDNHTAVIKKVDLTRWRYAASDL